MDIKSLYILNQAEERKLKQEKKESKKIEISK